MFRIITSRNVTPARRDRAISVANRYINNIQATRQYARDRNNTTFTVQGEPILNDENVSRMANRQYPRSTYMGLRNALGGANNLLSNRLCVLENRSSRRHKTEIASSTLAHAA